VIVLDASAVLAFLQQERGSDAVEQAMADAAACGAANWSEVAQKIHARGRDWGLARALLLSYGLTIEPVTAEDAETAAAAWGDRPELALGDRLCLALAERLDATVLTADRAWGRRGRIRQIR
jgi:PIN domain nuclease of toxin-antitoxin system